MSAQFDGHAPGITPEQLAAAGLQPVFCTLNQAGVWSPLVGTTGGVAFPIHTPAPGVPYRLAFRPPPYTLVVDVDDHDGQGRGPATIAAMEERFGPLPPTWRLSARGQGNPAGRRLYRIPADLLVTDAAFKAFGGSVEAVRTGHRFSWAPGDINPATGTPVEVFGPDGHPTTLPSVDQWPELPPAWIAYLRTAPQPVAKAPAPQQLDALGRFMAEEPPQRLSAAHAAIADKLQEVRACRPETGQGFRNTLMRAAFMFGGYIAGAPQFFSHAALEAALLQAVEDVWGAPDGDDYLWVEQGLRDGARRPFRVYDETAPLPVTQPAGLPDNVVPMPGVAQQPWQPERTYPVQQQAYTQTDGDHVDPLSWLRSKLVTAAGLKALPPPEPLVRGMLFADSLAWLIGAPGAGKSFVAVDLACSIATGTPWQGHPVQPGPVLYLVAEGVTGAGQRVAAWEQHHQRAADGVYFLPYPLQLGTRSEYVSAFQQLVAEIQPRLVVVDTQARTSVGVDENSAKDVGLLIGNLDDVRAACPWTTVLVIHHTPRGSKTPRGSTSIEGAADTILHTEKTDLQVTLSTTKQKDAPEAPELTMTMTQAGPSVVLVTQASGGGAATLTEPVMALYNKLLVHDGMWTTAKIEEAFGIPRATVQRYLQVLELEGLVRADREKMTHQFRALRHRLQQNPVLVTSPQPVDNLAQPVDNLVTEWSQGAQMARGHLAQPAQPAHEGAHDKTAGQGQGAQGAQVPAHPLANLPTAQGSLDPGLGKAEGSEQVLGFGVKGPESAPPAAPENVTESDALLGMPEPLPPAPKKRSEPKPGTKAYERAQAKAADKAARIAQAAGEPVSYPATVLRDGQVLKTPLAAAESLLEGLPVVTVDVETSGVPVGHKDFQLRLIQLGCADFAVDLDPSDPEQLQLASKVLTEAPALRAHSSTADIVPTALAGLVDFDSAMSRMDDTAIRAKLHDPQSTGQDAGLKRLSDYMLGSDSASTPADKARAELFKANGWLTEVKPDTPLERNGWYQADPYGTTYARYGGSDVLDTALIGDRLPPLPYELHWREQTVAHMVARVALKGLKLNGALVGDLMTEHTVKRAEWETVIRSWTNIENVGSDRQVANALLAMGVRLPYTDPSTRYPEGQPSVAAGVLETILGEFGGTEHPAKTLIEQVLQWRHHDTAITLFLTPYSQLIRDGDGRARPTVYTLGADTGRMSCTRPNAQQLPREGGFRAIYVADDGMTFIGADFSSVEIRVAAALSQDQALIRMLEEGAAAEALVASGQMTKREWQERYDPHAMAALMVYGPNWTKADRYAVKRGVFGRIYGGGVKTLAAQMRVSIAIAQKLIDAIDTLWPTLSAWTKHSTQMVERGLETTFTTYSGRVVHLPKNKAHAAGNYKIQGTARELLMDALLRWRETEWGQCTLWPVHDELDVMVPAADAERATAELVRCMETTLYGVRIVAEPSEPSTYWRDSA